MIRRYKTLVLVFILCNWSIEVKSDTGSKGLIHDAITACATALNIELDANIRGNIASLYEGNPDAINEGSINLKTETGFERFLEIFPVEKRDVVYANYISCLSNIIAFRQKAPEPSYSSKNNYEEMKLLQKKFQPHISEARKIISFFILQQTSNSPDKHQAKLKMQEMTALSGKIMRLYSDNRHIFSNKSKFVIDEKQKYISKFVENIVRDKSILKKDASNFQNELRAIIMFPVEVENRINEDLQYFKNNLQ